MELAKGLFFQTANKMLYTKAQAILLGLLYCFRSLLKFHIAFCNGVYIDEFFDYWNPKRAGE